MSKKRPPPKRPPPSRPRNSLLVTLPPAELRRVRPWLKTITLAHKQVLLKRGEPLRHVYFPNNGVCSVTAMMKSGAAVEVATVGNEGMLGLNAFFGGTSMPGESMVQIPSVHPVQMTAERMTVGAFQREMIARGALYDAVSRYSQGMIALIMQSTACMALHTVQQRCCRWLLMTHDRIKSDQFLLSQEFLAMMLGASRPTVTLVAVSLQQAGLIGYTRGRMTILDRAGLNAKSCECYSTIKTEFDRLGL